MVEKSKKENKILDSVLKVYAIITIIVWLSFMINISIYGFLTITVSLTFLMFVILLRKLNDVLIKLNE